MRYWHSTGNTMICWHYEKLSTLVLTQPVVTLWDVDTQQVPLRDVDSAQYTSVPVMRDETWSASSSSHCTAQSRWSLLPWVHTGGYWAHSVHSYCGVVGTHSRRETGVMMQGCRHNRRGFCFHLYSTSKFTGSAFPKNFSLHRHHRFPFWANLIFLPHLHNFIKCSVKRLKSTW